MIGERLNRYISRAASVSRRTADEIIRAGRVTVGGIPVTDPGFPFDPGRDEIRLDGNTVVAAEEEKIYLMAFKPDKVVTTMRDKEGRASAASLVGDLATRVFPVGRLDYHTTGLLLFTNDGEFAYKLTHPRFGVEKTYIVKVQGVPGPGKLKLLRRGLPIDGVMTNPAEVGFIEAKEGKAWVRIRIAEGRHHQVRKMFEAIGYRVMKLRRVAIGGLELSGVEPGGWRYLTGKELRDLGDYVRKKEADARQPARAAGEAGDRARRFVRRAPSGPPPIGERRGPRQPRPAWKRPPRGPSGGPKR